MDKKKILISLVVSTSLLFGSDSKTTPNKEELFMEKYVKNKSSLYKEGESSVSKENRIKLSKDVDLYEISKSDINNSSYDINISRKLEEKNKAEAIAQSINSHVRSKEFSSEVLKYEKYILNDEDFGIKKAMGKYAKQAQETVDNKYLGINYKNKFLANDERLIVAISSTVPKETVRNYMKELESVESDVLFVMNGFIGNNPKKIMPTLEYIQGLLIKKYGKTKEDTEAYKFRVDINPKLFSKYSIDKVPALIFVQNYNPYSEIQGNAQSAKMNGLEDENIFISYGDGNLKYSLNRINKSAKSKTLAKLIKNINKGFFDE